MFAAPSSDPSRYTDSTPRRAESARAIEFARELSELGLRAGDTVMVHSSMRAVRGRGRPGAESQDLRSAFRSVLGSDGTLVVPAYTPENSITSQAFADATAGRTVEELADYLHRPRDPHASVAAAMGAFAESIRADDRALRSDHPLAAVVALGGRAEEVTRGHGRTHFGPDSPMGRLYDARATVLAIGVGWGVVSVAHLAEYRHPHRSRRRYTCKIATSEGSSWFSFPDVALSDHDFPELGRDFEERHPEAITRGRVGAAHAFLLPVRPYVDFATAWMGVHRAPAAPASEEDPHPP
ncbi:aminoglycoside N(3)-acetyltransferase [Embleya sp. MST-111070]|uniref:aminoglycoside N(3)-acetyltransferase n=1 Tax=Embleya sp. MST-111070 TaxID=3398231 RepID=UPI003F7363C1